MKKDNIYKVYKYYVESKAQWILQSEYTGETTALIRTD